MKTVELECLLAMYVYQTAALMICRDKEKKRRHRQALRRLNAAVRSLL